MEFGVALSTAEPDGFVAAGLAAERLGFESVWVADTQGDAAAAWAELATRTQRIRLVLPITELALRDPLAAAHAVARLDARSGGRAEASIGPITPDAEAPAEATPGRLDEAILVCKRLWHEGRIEHRGACFDLGRVALAAPPRQRPWPPLHVGGRSEPSLHRAARVAEGWVGPGASGAALRPPLERLHALRRHYETADGALCVSVCGPVPDAEARRTLETAGVDRVVLHPGAGVEAGWLEATGKTVFD